MTSEIPSESIDRDPPLSPEITLHEGTDFINDEELLGLIEQNLQERGISPEGVLVCGYNALSSKNASRRHIFAFTLEEMKQGSGYDDSDPIDYAWDYINDGQPALGIYDPQAFSGLDPHDTDFGQPYLYKLRPGLSLEDATLLVVKLRAINT